MQIKRRERESDPAKTKKECCVTAKLMVMSGKRQTAPRGRAFNPGKTVMGAKFKLYFSLAEGKNN